MESKQDGSAGVSISRLGVVSLGFGILSPLVVLMVGALDPYFAITGVLGLSAGIAALVQIQRSKGGLKGRFYAVLGILTSGAWVGLILWRMVIPAAVEARQFATRRPTFQCASTELKQTLIAPTLDTRMPAATNVIWWEHITDDVNGVDIAAKDYYAAAGNVEKVTTEMKERFPGIRVPEFKAAGPNDVVRYSFLRAQVKFEKAFDAYPHEFTFYDSDNHETDVDAFGVWVQDSIYADIRQQVRVLYYSEVRRPSFDQVLDSEFAVDLSTNSTPYQVVAAAIDPNETMRQTLVDLDEKIGQYGAGDAKNALAFEEPLLLPDIFYSITNHSDSTGGEGTTVVRQVEVRLDRGGVVLRSDEFNLKVTPVAPKRQFVFNRPFLVYMKKRGAQRPFFVMWVDNAELLTRPE